MTTRRRVTCVLLVAPVLVACSGDSGGSPSGPDNSTGTPLVVSSTQPGSGQQDFPLNWTVGAHFATDLDPSSPSSAFTVTQGSTPVQGSVTYAGADATFTPAAELAANLSYTATISTALKGADGGTLATPYSWSFTTGDCTRFLHVDSFPLGPQASGDVWSESMTTDGTTIYLLRNPVSGGDSVTVLTIDPQARTVTGSVRVPVVPSRTADSPPVPDGIAEILDIAWYNGALWASGAWYIAATQSMDGGVYQPNLTTGAPERTISLLTSSDPNQTEGVGSIASDGTNLYVSVRRQYFIPAADTTMIVKFDPASTTQISTAFPLLASPTQVHQMDFGGGFLWVMTEEGPPRRIHKVDPDTGETLSQICVDQDGGNILYVNGDFWSAAGSEMRILSMK